MKKSVTILLTLFTISAFSLFSQPQTGNFAISYNDRGINSSIYFWVPTDYDSTKSYPFILAWHGAGDTGGNMRAFMAYLLAQRVGAILVCPDANQINKQDASFFGNLVSASYSYTMTNYNIDKKKIIIMGFSWGGGFAYQIGLLNPTMFQGIIGLAPAIGALDTTMWKNIKKLRMATILGDKDFNYDAVSGLMNNIKNQGADILYIVKPGVYHVDNTYFNSQAIIDDFRACYDYVINEQLGVTENNSESVNYISIFPNPATDFISVFNETAISFEKTSIFSTEGVKLIEADYSPVLDVRSLANGVYYSKFTSKGKTITKKFIIIR